ncbi:hypothetical protein BpHYR1_010197 [Brachionus plicatilis]|uniref:Secreted protein n=1 Tax=Brachionus plicatilis TaxID=10195 RepID=A0A3M7QZU4_BRAPC|nr:hypothetical protein BpHYR1_010197 [Brachionus plicatilis]
MNKALNLVLVLALVASLMVVSEARRGQQRERPGLRPRPRPESDSESNESHRSVTGVYDSSEERIRVPRNESVESAESNESRPRPRPNRRPFN